MSLEILGSNDQKFKIITDNKIESIIDQKILSYNVYKNKYLNQKIIQKEEIEHLYKQLIILFYSYDNNKSLDYNINKFIIYINKINNEKNTLKFINEFLNNNSIFIKLEDALHKILKKLNKSYIKLHDNLFIDIINIQKLLNKLPKQLNNENIIIINKSIVDLKNTINEINIIEIKPYLIKLDDNKYYSNEFISKLFLNLDNIINNTNIIKSNILKIDSINNIIIENIYKIYLQLN